MKSRILMFVCICLSATFSFAASDQLSKSQQKGLDIATEADQRNDGFVDNKAVMTMILRDKRGKESTRLLQVRNLEGSETSGSGDKSLMIFDTPRAQKGSALLTYSYKGKPDDQWVYLPAAKRVKRIVSRAKSGPFVGSEFAFEDFNSPEVEKYRYNYLRDEVVAGSQCYVVERYPTDKTSGYKRQQVWLDKKELRVFKIDFYDRKDSLLKTLIASEYTLYLERFWRSQNQMMTNHQTGKSTELKFSDFQFKVGLKETDFSINSLKRAR